MIEKNVGAFYVYRDKYSLQEAVSLVKTTYYADPAVIEALNKSYEGAEINTAPLDVYVKGGNILFDKLNAFGYNDIHQFISFTANANQAFFDSLLTHADQIDDGIRFVNKYGDTAVDIGSKVNSQVLSEITKYGELPMAYLVQGLTFDSTRISNILNQLSETNIEKCKTVIALIAERPEETPEDLLDVFSHENIEGVIMYLDNLSDFPYNMDDVWEMKPTERGVKIENYYAATEYRTWYHIGAEYNGYFPVIDFQKDNTVISMKSLDPRLPTYQNGEKIKEKITQYIKTLSSSDITVANSLDLKKKLHIVIPEGTMISEDILSELKTVASDAKVDLKITELI